MRILRGASPFLATLRRILAAALRLGARGGGTQMTHCCLLY
jgi:hypothetical protein